MSRFEFNAPINGPVQMGDRNSMSVAAGQSVDRGAENPAELLRLAVQLAALVRVEAPAVEPQAVALRGELEQARDAGEALEPSRVRRWIELIGAGVTAGSGAAALAERIVHLIG